MKSKKKSREYKNYFVWFSSTLVLFDWYLQFANKLAGVGVENSGVSFGLGGDVGVYFRFVLPAFLLLIVIFLWKRGMLSNLFIVMLIIGGVGNMIPRVVWGHVWDYVRVPYIELWINLSDVLISVASLSYILVGNDRDSDRL